LRVFFLYRDARPFCGLPLVSKRSPVFSRKRGGFSIPQRRCRLFGHRSLRPSSAPSLWFFFAQARWRSNFSPRQTITLSVFFLFRALFAFLRGSFCFFLEALSPFCFALGVTARVFPSGFFAQALLLWRKTIDNCLFRAVEFLRNGPFFSQRPLPSPVVFSRLSGRTLVQIFFSIRASDCRPLEVLEV